jgi:phospholipid/cholesterol/gamma-HCH transport system ATP-binding protein
VNFEQGKTNLIIGRSGSGKTVLLKSIVGLLPVEEGEVWYEDRLFNRLDYKEKKLIRREIGMLFQGSALFDSISVAENVRFPLDMFTRMSRKEKQNRVDFCLERVNLKDAHHLQPSELSGGMMKRTAIARAIALNPKYLFCDEPNSGLDPKTAILIDNLIHEITKEFGMTTIINTHDMNSVMEIGENIAFMAYGILKWKGDKDRIFESACYELEDFLKANSLARRIMEDKKSGA